MKHFHAFLLICIFVATTSFLWLKENKLETGFYYLAEKESDGVLITDVDDETTYAIEKEPIVDRHDFLKVKYAKRDFKPTPQRVIEIKLTKEGKKRWKAAQRRISKTGESIMFVFNDKIYLEKKILGNYTFNEPWIDLCFKPSMMEEVFNQISRNLPPEH